jgi:Cu(I)/Ag(I) efflux system membrane fusion protein
MFAQVSIHADGENNVLMIPREAVIRTGKQDRVVLALGEGHFKSVAVSIGRLDEQFAEIIKGLDVGEAVVTSAQFLLDSESSKTSDFKRLNHDDDQSNSVWVGAEILSSMEDHRMVTVKHEAVNDWDWPAKTMGFSVSDKVDMQSLKPGTQLHMEISKADGDRYEITSVHIQGQKTKVMDSMEAGNDPSMDHSAHQTMSSEQE